MLISVGPLCPNKVSSTFFCVVATRTRWINNYECTVDQELLRLQPANNIARAWPASGQPAEEEHQQDE